MFVDPTPDFTRPSDDDLTDLFAPLGLGKKERDEMRAAGAAQSNNAETDPRRNCDGIGDVRRRLPRDSRAAAIARRSNRRARGRQRQRMTDLDARVI